MPRKGASVCWCYSSGMGRTGMFPLDSSKRYCAYLLEQAIAQLPEDCETILGIFDLRGFRTRNADFGFVRFLVRARTTCCGNHPATICRST